MSNLIQKFKNEWQHSDTGIHDNDDDIMEIISASDIELMPFQTSDDGIDEVKQFWKDAESFYDNLQHIFYFQTGQRDNDPWYVLGQFSNNVYFYINAWCDYTGFDCRAGIRVHCSKDLDFLKTMGIVDKTIYH